MTDKNQQGPKAGLENMLEYMKPKQRKIIQISACAADDEVLYCLCDDGSLWNLDAGRWYKEPSIPQDKE